MLCKMRGTISQEVLPMTSRLHGLAVASNDGQQHSNTSAAAAGYTLWCRWEKGKYSTTGPSNNPLARREGLAANMVTFAWYFVFQELLEYRQGVIKIQITNSPSPSPETPKSHFWLCSKIIGSSIISLIFDAASKCATKFKKLNFRGTNVGHNRAMPAAAVTTPFQPCAPCYPLHDQPKRETKGSRGYFLSGNSWRYVSLVCIDPSPQGKQTHRNGRAIL